MPGGKVVVVTDREILEMIFFPVVNEACRVLDEGIASKASDLDVSVVLGMGFPSYRYVNHPGNVLVLTSSFI